jgi:site-specific recombinase XerD
VWRLDLVLSSPPCLREFAAATPDNTGSVRVTRKGRKTQVIPLNYKACQALEAYLKVRPEVDHEALFVIKFKEPMSPRAIQYRVQKYFKEAGIKGASVPLDTRWPPIM